MQTSIASISGSIQETSQQQQPTTSAHMGKQPTSSKTIIIIIIIIIHFLHKKLPEQIHHMWTRGKRNKLFL